MGWLRVQGVVQVSVNRVLNILNQDAITRFREFLWMWWERARLEALLAPIELPDGTGAAVRAVEDPEELWAVNPFIPLMLSNSAALVGEFIDSHPKGRLAVILRPCELSTLVELQKRSWFLHQPPLASNLAEGKEVVTVGVDCTGTYGAAEFTRRLLAYGRDSVFCQAFNLTSAVEVGKQQYRTACQLCDLPASSFADITIGSTGIVQEGYLLVIARDNNIDARWCLGEATDGLAIERVIQRRGAALAAIAGEQARKWTQRQPGEVGSFLASMSCCTLCADCLDACPLYHGDLSSMLGVGGESQSRRPQLSELIEVTRWLASCSGCGMCAEACSTGIPLVPLILHLSRLIRAELNYSAGNPLQPLPWSSTG
jgi:formate dehydrogenase subunit beta